MRNYLSVAVLFLALAGCGGDGDSASESPPPAPPPTVTPPPPPPPTPAAAGPMDCLERAGLEDPEQRDTNLWRATDPRHGTLVIIDRLESAAEARAAVRDADLVWGASAGRYFVNGAARSAPNAEDHRGTVELVAACLKGR